MTKATDAIRESIQSLARYEPGKPIEEVQRELGLPRIVKLASNEYPEGPFPEVIEALQTEITELHRYPDASWFSMAASVADAYGIGEDELVFGNGANEILELLVHVLGEGGGAKHFVFGRPSFPIYGLLCRSHFDAGRGVDLDSMLCHDLDAMADAIDEDTRAVFVCNPNNPTGSYVGAAALRKFLERVPARVVVILDEAYVEFATAEDFPDFFALRNEFQNLVSVRSFSKIYSLAGLRVGYAIGHPDLIAMLQRVRQPFNVNRLAQLAVSVSVKHPERVAQRRADNRRRLDGLHSGLLSLGCKVYPGEGNFLLAMTPEASTTVFDRLLKHGVIVRPMHSFGLRDGSFRVNTGTDEENEIFLESLASVLAVGDTV